MPALKAASSKVKSKNLLVKCVSMVGSGTIRYMVRPREAPKLVAIDYDPVVKRRVMFIEEAKIRGVWTFEDCYLRLLESWQFCRTNKTWDNLHTCFWTVFYFLILKWILKSYSCNCWEVFPCSRMRKRPDSSFCESFFPVRNGWQNIICWKRCPCQSLLTSSRTRRGQGPKIWSPQNLWTLQSPPHALLPPWMKKVTFNLKYQFNFSAFWIWNFKAEGTKLNFKNDKNT